MLPEQTVSLQADMEQRMAPKVSGYAAPSDSIHNTTKIPRFTPRTPRDDKKPSVSSPRPSKLPTPRSSSLKKSSTEIAQDKELKSLHVGKLKESSIPKIATSKQHGSPRHVITPRTLRTPSTVSHKHIKQTEIRPGAYPGQQKVRVTTDDKSSQSGQTSTDANKEDLTRFADDLLESSSCDENLVQPISEQLPPATDFSDYESMTVSQSTSHDAYEDLYVHPAAKFHDITGDKENLHPLVPPLPLHLLEDTDTTAETIHYPSNRENTNEG